MNNPPFNDPVISEYLRVERKITDTFFEKAAPLLKKHRIFFQRETNGTLDRLGVDALMAYQGRIHYVDFKHHSAYDVVEKHPNYAFELESARRPSLKKRYKGWLVDPKKVSQAYTFLFWSGTPDNISAMRVCSINRETLVTRLMELGLNVENWSEYIAFSPKVYMGNHYWFLNHGIRIVQSRSIPEAPINLVVPWELLQDITVIDEVFAITKESKLSA